MATKTVDTNMTVVGTLNATSVLQNGTGLVTTDTIGASGKGYVNHGATAGVARPTGYAQVEWIGSVEPTNAVNGDTWVDTA